METRFRLLEVDSGIQAADHRIMNRADAFDGGTSSGIAVVFSMFCNEYKKNRVELGVDRITRSMYMFLLQRGASDRAE